MKSFTFLLALFCSLYMANAFSPSPASPGFSIKTARRVPGLKPTHAKQTIVLRMAEEKTTEEGEAVAAEAESTEVAAPKQGEAFYDDEVCTFLPCTFCVKITKH